MSNSLAVTIPSRTHTVIRIAENDITVGAFGTWQQAVASYLFTLKSQPSTQGAYKKALVQFFRWTEREHIATGDISRDDVKNFRDYLHSRLNDGSDNSARVSYVNINGTAERKLELSTINLYLCAVRNFFAYLEEEGKYRNIAKGIKSYKVEHAEFVKMHLTEEQAKAFLSHFNEKPYVAEGSQGKPHDKEEHFRDLAMTMLMLHNGLRTIEISRARVGGLREEYGGHVLYIRGKGRETASDFVVLSDKMNDVLKDYLALRGPVSPDAPLFSCTGKRHYGHELSTRRIQAVVKEGLEAIGLDSRSYSPHSLRHTTAVQLLKKRVSLYDIQMVMRHTDPKITERYLLSIKKEERILNATERALDDVFKFD